MTRKEALRAMEKLRRIEQLEMQLDQLQHWSATQTSDFIDEKESPFPSYIAANLFDREDIDNLIAVVQKKLTIALAELELL
jgi:hypothetical protein